MDVEFGPIRQYRTDSIETRAGRGKKLHDKRDDLKIKAATREMRQAKLRG